MRLKSYFAGDVGTALNQARDELGPEAMLIHSRRSGPEAKHLGEFEVVVGVAAAEAAGSPEARASAPDGGLAAISSEVLALRRNLEQLAAAVRRTAALGALRGASGSEMPVLFARLVENDVDPEIAHAVLDAVRSSGIPAGEDDLERAVASELGRRFTTAPHLGSDPSARPLLAALVGPCGAGKTTTLVKLAVLHGLTARRPTQIISMDNYRVAGCGQLRSYAAILGVGFQALETTAALAQALEEHRQKDLILIDTPGFGPRDMEDAVDLARLLAARPDIDVHLVLSAATKSADLTGAVDRFEIFRPAKLLFTRLDETGSFGALLNEPARTGKPLSFLAAGQRIPEDLEPASVERVVDLLLRRGDEPDAAGRLAP